MRLQLSNWNDSSWVHLAYGWPVKPHRRPERGLRIILAVLFLGPIFYLLKGHALDFSLWGAIAMATVFIGIGLVLDLVLTRRR